MSSATYLAYLNVLFNVAYLEIKCDGRKTSTVIKAEEDNRKRIIKSTYFQQCAENVMVFRQSL